MKNKIHLLIFTDLSKKKATRDIFRPNNNNCGWKLNVLVGSAGGVGMEIVGKNRKKIACVFFCLFLPKNHLTFWHYTI